MSLILDALNRAEQERNEKNHIPTLQSMHSSGDKVAPSLLRRLHLERWLIAMVVAYLVFDFFRDRLPDPAPPSSPPAEQAPMQTAPAPESASTYPRAGVSVTPPPSSRPAADTAAPMEAVPAANRVKPPAQGSTPKAEPTQAVAVPAKTAASKAAPAGAGRQDAAASPARSDSVQPRPTADSNADTSNLKSARTHSQPAAGTPVRAKSAPDPKVESLYRMPRDSAIAESNFGASLGSTAGAKQRQGAAFLRAQQITDLPLALRQQIPSLKYGDHWPADRKVLLNGTAYQEGDIIVAGLKLIEVSEHGIVLEFENERFRLDAYNSWINFQ